MMKCVKFQIPRASVDAERGSTFILVLWIAFGLVSIALYFGQSMSLELRASDNRACGLAAEQAIEGAARYVASILANQLTNGTVPDAATYLSEAVPVGDAHFWLIGRETNTSINLNGSPMLAFGLIDEGSKINVNSAPSNTLAGLLDSFPRANQDIASAIIDWRSTNSSGTYQTYYGTQAHPYQTKHGPFESIDELRLIYGADMDALVGEDLNRNGILDPNEDINRNGQFEPGILEYVTVYSREPNTYSNGLPRISLTAVTANGPLNDLFVNAFGSTRAGQLMINLGLAAATATGGPRSGTSNRPIPPKNFASPLQLYVQSQMSADEFAQIANDIGTTTGPTIDGRVNVNTASATVLSSLPGLSSNPDVAQTLVTYRQTNPDKLSSVAWVADAIGKNNGDVLTALQGTDCLTTMSYQFTADVAALGPYGRGYRRVRFVFDTSEGTPKIIYRQDLTHLGWALGADLRRKLLEKQTNPGKVARVIPGAQPHLLLAAKSSVNPPLLARAAQ
jgi:type II secretory pathway component PulK